MVAIFTGAGVGFERGSGSVLGARGLLGGASLGNGGEQVYVNAANGNLMISRQDEFLVGRGPDLSIARTYNSKGDFSDENGDNWRQSTDRRVYGLTGDPKADGSTIKRVSGDGAVVTYVWNSGDDLYIADDGGGAYDTLSYSVSGNVWTWTDGNSRVNERYEAGGTGSWRIAQQSDPDGNSVSFIYDATTGKLEKAITADGGFTEYVWDTTFDRIAQVVTGYTDLTAYAAKTLTRTSYGYHDTTGKLATVTVDLTPTNTTDTATYKTDYIYNAAGRVESITQSDGSSLEILYDSSGRVIRLTQAASATVNRVTEIWYGAGYTRITDPSGHITRLYYDSFANLTTIQHDPADGNAAPTYISFTYNANGDVLTVVDQAGNTTTYSEYDDRGNAATERGPAGTYIRRAFGSRNELLAETAIGSDTGSSAANHTTRYVYDSENHLRYVVTSEGRVTEHRYNAAGRPVSTIRYAGQGPDPAAHGITSIYVSFTEAQMNAWVSAIADKSTAERTDSFYDHRGNVSRVVNYSVLSKFGEGGGGPLTITPGANTTVTQQADGLYRVVKTTGSELGYDADAHSSVRADGDFVVQLRPLQNDKFVIAGVATSPATDAGSSDPDYAFYFNENGLLYYRESGAIGYFGRSYSAGANYWLAREQGVVRYYVGSTLAAAKTAGPLRSVADSRAFYFDSSLRPPGAGVDVSFTSNPITDDGNTTVTVTADGLHRITKTGGTHAVFDAAASSSTAAAGDFVLRLRPPRKDRSVAAGVSTAPATSLARTDIDYGFYFHSSGSLQYVNSSGSGTSLNTNYAAGENFWLVRSGTTISHYRGTTLAAAIASGPLRSVTGATGTFYFDSSFYTANAAVDVEFTPSLPATAELSRTYFTYDQAGNLLSRFREGQNPEIFVYDGMGRLTTSTDLNRGTTRIVFNNGGRETVVTLDNGLVRTSTYNLAGELTAVTEAGDYLTATPADSYRYDFNGRLRIATDSTGRTTYFIYDKLSRKVAEIAEDGATVEYRYDALDRLTATVRYANKVSSGTLTTLGSPYSDVDMAEIRPGPNGGDIWNWSFYDAESRLIRSIDGTGSVTTFEYDRSHRLVKSYAYAKRLTDLSGLKAVPPTDPGMPTASAADSITRTFYDEDGNLFGTLDGEGYLHRIIYDWMGRKTADLTYTEITDPLLRASGTFWELRGSVAPDDFRIHRYVYDGQGQLRFAIDTLDQVTEYRYDRAGLRTTTLRYPAAIVPNADYSFANIKALVGAAGLASHDDTRTSWSVYDAAGRPAYAIDGENAVTGFSYDKMGQTVRTVRYAAERETTSLPSLATMNSWAASQASNTANRVTRNYYSDRSGEVRFTVDAEGYATRFDYDEEGRVVAEVRWNSKIAVSDGSEIDDVETAANDSGGFVTRSFAYDIAGRLSSTYDGNGVRRLYSYNANGTLLWDIADYLGADESRTRFEYDGAGRVAKRHDAYNSPTDAVITSYSYDAFGNVATVTDPRGHVTRYYYDQLGQELLCWDAEDYLTEKSYDAFGQVTKVTRRHNKATLNATTGLPAAATHASDSSTIFTYDKEGRLVTENQGGIVITGRTYTAFGEIRTVTRGTATTTFDHDRMGRLSKVTDAMSFVESYGFNAFGDRTTLTSKLGPGVVTHYGYDRRGLLTVETLPMSSTRADGSVAADSVTNRFEYDARGNRITRIEADDLVEKRTTRYRYDAADRLIETRHDAVTALSQTDHKTPSTVTPLEKYSYDRRGNVTEIAAVHEIGGIATVHSRTLLYYDLLNRKTDEINPLGAYTSYDYDDNGNLLSTKAYGTAIALPAAAGGTAPAPPAGTPRQTTYSYDKLNRLKTTNVLGIRTGAWTTSSYVTADNQTVTTELTYDSRGNLILARDGNGGLVHSYYDKANRKTDQVDQEGYYTKWTLDAEGNVLSERRYDNKATGYTTETKPTVTPDTVNDRVTNFSYDKNGRRLSETRTGVIGWANGAGNTLAGAGTDSLVRYEYNALGQVTKKTEATLDAVVYTYDNAGRLIQETRAAYINSSGVSVSPTVRYSYDGLNNLTRTRQGGATTVTGDRITRYTYGAGGRLATMTDAANNAYTYYYDAAGNRVRESYSRLKADGTSSNDSVLYVRDKLGRITSQRIATLNGTAWTNGDSQNIAYNLYGEVSQRGLNGLWQEKFAYDLAGRLWRTTSGDGLWRYFVHDGNGNRTLAIESDGADMADMSLTDAIALAKGAGTTVGAIYVDNVNAAITVFDKRGQATKTILPFRQLSSTAKQTLTISRLYNAFGEATQETDARNHTTNFVYNTLGRLIEKKSPTVRWTSEAGAAADARPTETYYYDLSGRLIGSRDANQTQIANGAATGGLITTRRLLAGTGYGGTEALVSVEYRVDSSDWRTWYDVYGDARKLRNGLATSDDPTVLQTAADELRNYDAMGRLTSVEHRGRLLTDYYAYDLHGQRIKHWNNFPGTPDVETTDYDRQGRVTATVAFGGDTTTTVYAWDGSITNSGVSGNAQIGGWVETTTFENGRTLIEKSDMFGRLLSKTDLGSHVFTFGYDKAGRMTSRGGGEALSYSWLNTGLLGSASTTTGSVASNNWSSRSTTYGYDAAGHVTSERTVDEGEESYQFYWNPSEPDVYSNSWSNVTQNATAAYDALGRMTSWSEVGSTATPAASIAWQYDLNGNIRRSNASYRALDLNGAASSAATIQDQWSRYDAMNRVVSAKGADYTYDAAGQRKTAARTERVAVQVLVDESIPSYRTVYHDLDTLETYAYRADGTLLDVRIAADQLNEGTGTVTAGTSQLRASYTSDALGRVTQQVDWLGNGTNAAYDRKIVYNAKGQVESEEVSNKQYSGGSWNTYTSYVTNTFGADASYALGAVVTVTSSNWKNGVDSGSNGAKDTYTANSFAWYDGAVQSQIVFDSESGSSTNPLWTTTYVYNGAGQLSSAQIDDGRRRSVTWTNDLTGQALRRDEADSLPGGDPHEIWYRFGGKQLGYVGNNGTLDTDYAASIDNRTKAPPANPGAFRFGATEASSHADFDLGVAPLTSYAQGGAGGSYTVEAGDSLATIAARLWGDSSLWYKLAEANGLSAGSALVQGQSITVPSGVMRSAHNASTFRPYDPAETLGETSPTTPQPNKRSNKCGVFGAILLVAIAVAVSAITYGALTGPATGLLASVGAGALSGAAGSIASQAVGVATGIQDGFSWKGVAMAALGGAVGGGLGQIDGAFGKFLNADKFLSNVAKGALSSTLTQGIGVATGLQNKFDFAGVAISAIGAGLAGESARRLGVSPTHVEGGVARNAAFYTNQAVSGMAGAIASAAARSLADGSSFGDNLVAALPHVIGSTIGNMIADPVVARIGAARQRAAAEGRAQDYIDRIPGDLRARIESAGGTLVPTPEGVRIDGYDPDRLRAVADASGGVVRWGTDGMIVPTVGNWHFLDVAQPGWMTNGSDQGGVNYYFAPGVASVQSDWIGLDERGVYRFLTGAGGTYLYETGSETFAALGIRVSYGAALPPANIGGASAAAGMSGSLNLPSGLSLGGLHLGWDRLTLGGRYGLTIDGHGVSLGGSYGINVSSRSVTIGGSSGIYADSSRLTIGGRRYGINIDDSSVTIGGRSGLFVDGHTFNIGGGDGFLLTGNGVSLFGRDVIGSQIPRIGGRRPINSRYAGGTHPSGVEFSPQGFPNFGPHARAQVVVEGLTGDYAHDERLANREAGFPRTPRGHVWHHVEDRVTMQLISQTIHNSVRHTGGASVIRNGGFDR